MIAPSAPPPDGHDRTALAGAPNGLRKLVASSRDALETRAGGVPAAGAEGSARAREAAEQLGWALGKLRAAQLDEILLTAYDGAFPVASEGRRAVDLAAVGSYGRGAVALGSDVDVRLLVGSLEQAGERAEQMLYSLWDSGLAVGHQVQTVDELVAAAAADLPTATSLLDWRPLAGEAGRSSALARRAAEGLFAHSELGRFVARLEQEVSERHRRFGASIYSLEPDVKQGPGGLRDLDVAWWAARARWRVSELDDLLRIGVVSERELAGARAARELLWRIRNLLHARAGRRADRLGYDEQEEVAARLGYEGGPSAAAAQLMSDFYRAARTVGRFRDLVLARAKPALSRSRRPAERDLGGGLRLGDGVVTLAEPAQLARRPVLALELLREAIERHAAIDERARSLVASLTEDPAWAAELRADPSAARLFVGLVGDCRDTALRAGGVVAELHEVGLLLAMVPELAPLVGQVHRDAYHSFTVDAHSVAAVERLAAIARGEPGGSEELGGAWDPSLALRLAAELTRPQVLLLATLLHDLGKALDRPDHARRGAELARGVLERLGLAAADVDDACQLIRLHLQLYHFATRRDVDDPSALGELLAHVGGQEALRHLYLLTVADLATTSVSALSWWKGRMLDEAYLAAARALGGGGPLDAAREAQRRAAVLAALPSRPALLALGPARVEGFLATMPLRYLLANSIDSILAHAELVCAGGEAPVRLALAAEGSPTSAELCVVADDRPGLLALIAAALSGARLDVHGAQIYSRRRPAQELGEGSGDAALQAVDVFWIRDPTERPEGIAAWLPKLERDMAAALQGRLEPRQLARIGRRAPAGRTLPTRVQLDDDASADHTLVEVFTHDRPGLLFTLADALHQLGLGISLAKISTEGARAIDVFYVRDGRRNKVDVGRRTEVRDALVTAIAGMDQRREEA